MASFHRRDRTTAGKEKEGKETGSEENSPGGTITEGEKTLNFFKAQLLLWFKNNPRTKC